MNPLVITSAVVCCCLGCATPRIASGRVLDQHGDGVAEVPVSVRTTVVPFLPGSAPACILPPLPFWSSSRETGKVEVATGPDGRWRAFLPWSSSAWAHITPPPGTIHLSDHLWQSLGFESVDGIDRLWRIPPDGPTCLWKRWSTTEVGGDGWWYPLHLLPAVPGRQPDAVVRMSAPGVLELRVLHGGLLRTREPFPVQAPDDGYADAWRFTASADCRADYYWRRSGAVVRHGVVRLEVGIQAGRGRISAMSVLRCDPGRRVDHPPLGEGCFNESMLADGGPDD